MCILVPFFYFWFQMWEKLLFLFPYYLENLMFSMPDRSVHVGYERDRGGGGGKQKQICLSLASICSLQKSENCFLKKCDWFWLSFGPLTSYNWLAIVLVFLLPCISQKPDTVHLAMHGCNPSSSMLIAFQWQWSILQFDLSCWNENNIFIFTVNVKETEFFFFLITTLVC